MQVLLEYFSHPGDGALIPTPETESDQRRLKNRTLVLALGALGVVYGDIGTSPLYAIRECFHGHHAIALTPGNIFGVMSLVFWSLTIVVSIKYVLFILLADNHGEGGIFALLGLISAGGRNVSPRLRAGLGIRRDSWCGASLWRWHHHAGDLGPFGRRGSRGCHPGGDTDRVAPHLRGPLFALSFTALGNRGHREDFRPGHDALVCIDRRSGAWSKFFRNPISYSPFTRFMPTNSLPTISCTPSSFSARWCSV